MWLIVSIAILVKTANYNRHQQEESMQATWEPWLMIGVLGVALGMIVS
jgi:hypothetical protein